MAISAARVVGATRRAYRVGALGLALLALGCAVRAAGAPESMTTLGAESTRAVTVTSALDLTPGPPTHPTPLAAEPAWQRAKSGDPIDLARLADCEGTSGLLEGVAEGRSLALTALAALPYADDAELALGRLCELASIVDPARAEPLLRAIRGVVAYPPAPVERLDPEGFRTCAGVLARLNESPQLSVSNRDLAASAAALVEEHTAR